MLEFARPEGIQIPLLVDSRVSETSDTKAMILGINETICPRANVEIVGVR